MSLLTRHIEYLLLEHDQVVVPGLGTFVCNSQALHHDEAGMFYVPRRDVSFIPEEHDDGLLVDSVAHQEHCSIADSRNKITQWVEESLSDMRDYGTADLGNLGQMVMDDAQMVFQPCKAGLSSPAYYGLDNFEMPVLPLLAVQIKQAVERVDKAGSNSKHIVIRLNRTVVNYVASIAASILLFFAFTTPTVHTGVGQAALSPGFFVPTSYICEEQQEDCVDENVTEQEEDVVTVEATFSRYAVVVASSIRQRNAEAMVERLQSRSIDGAQVFVHGDMVRVAFLGYNTREDAIAAASHIRTLDSELSGAWVYEIK